MTLIGGAVSVGICAVVCAAMLSGCGSTAASSAYTEEIQPVRRLQESAPTAREMEANLAGADAVAPPPVSNGANGHHNRSQEGDIPAERVLPPVVRNPAPHIEEMMTIPTGELRGGNFPGLSSPQEPLVVAAAQEAQQDAAIEEARRAAEAVIEARLAAFESELGALRQSLAQSNGSANSDDAVRFAAIEREIAELRQQPVSAAPSSAEVPAELRERLSRTEREIAELREQSVSAAGSSAEVPAELRERLSRTEREIAELRQQSVSAAPATAEVPVEWRERLSRIEAEVAGVKRDSAVANPEQTAQVEQRFARLESRLEELQLSLDEAAHSAMQPVAMSGDVSVQDALPSSAFAEPETVSFDDYRIGSGDLLEFQSFNDETLGREVTVRYDGFVSLPLIPDIHVAERTRSEAEAMIRDAYTRIFRNPQISLLVRETTSKTFTIIGDIETPGIYPYAGETKLIDAISQAGGLRRRNANSSVGGFVGITGQLTKALVVRERAGERAVIQYDLRGIGSPGATHAADAPVYYGDLIYIPEGVNLVYLLGESRNPVIVELTEGMTLLQMLALSGGFNASTARLRDVLLIREIDSEQSRVMHLNVRKMLKSGMDMPLNAGDIVYLPQKTLVRVEEFVRRATGTILPVLELYNNAVEAYYARDIAQALLDQGSSNRTLDYLQNIEQFGTSTQNIVNLYGRP